MNDYSERFQQAVNYIESNLTESITLAGISRAACLSAYHFSRVFHFYLGETLSSYIRKRRLTEASKVLVETHRPILEIALEYRFESQEAFTRAFKRQFHLTPAKLRKYGKLVRRGEILPLTTDKIQHILHGGITMNPEIVNLDDERARARIIVGMKCINTMKKNHIPQLWFRFITKRNQIRNMIDGTTYGIYLYDPAIETKDVTDDLEFGYLAGVEVLSYPESHEIPKGMMVHEIPARQYAVFTHRGRLMELQKTYDYIYKTWLPGSGTDFLSAEHFEYHDQNFTDDTPESKTQIYIPVKE